MMNEPSTPLSQYRGPTGALALGAYQGAAPPAQYDALVAAPTGYAQGNPYPAQGAYQGPAHAGYAQGNPYPTQGISHPFYATYYHGPPAVVVMAPPLQHTAPPPNRERRFLEGCLAVFCYCLRDENIPSDASCDDVCSGDCF